MSPLGILLILLIILLLVPGLFVTGLKWLLIIALVVFVVGLLTGGWRSNY